MRFTVVWLPGAQRQLARIWNRAADRQAVSKASNIIDHLLKFAPLSVGQPRGMHRRLRVHPLEVVYRVSPEDCLVEVRRVSHV